MRGLRWAEAKHIDALTGGGKAFYEVVVGPGLGGSAHTLKSVGFRARYGAAVLAMYRADQRIEAKLGDIPLRLGDTLLVLADAAFRHRWREGGDFLLLAPIRGVLPHQRRKAWVVGLLGAAFIAVTGLNLVPILQGSLALVLGLVATRVLTVRQAREAVDLNIVVLIAAGIGLGAAVQSTGLAVAAADGLVTIFRPFGNVGALAGVILSTLILTELVGHNAAAVLIFPIAVATAAVTGSDPRPFVIGVAMGASLSFLSPLGYQTNLMVYALGGYRFTDFTRIGLPITTICFVLELLLIPLIFPF
jgi:di/tricarboxylate transporter